MNTSLIQSLFNFMSNNIFAIIYLFAIIETALVVAIFYMVKKHEKILLDVCDNLLKGFRDAPDKDSTLSINERIQTALDFITYKISTNATLQTDFVKNANKISQRPLYSRHYKIEMFASVMSTVVQIFPLLGILGTILAIAQTALKNGGAIDVSSLSNAFVLAMDTTILGLVFSILFMVIESSFWPKIERVINESQHYKQILTSINLSVTEDNE